MNGRYSVGSATKAVVRAEVRRSIESLQTREHQYFARVLGQKHAWRAFEAFADCCVYLDIETDGSPDGAVTAIGLYDGNEYVCLTRGEDLESFRDRISHYSMIVSFCGNSFDVPVLVKRFGSAWFDHIHIDLHPLLRSIGYRGGLKAIEKEFGIERSDATTGLTGYDAVKLWRRAERGNEEAREVFIQYNREDTVNLEKLAKAAVGKLRDGVRNEE